MTEAQRTALGSIIRSLLLIFFTTLGVVKHVDSTVMGVAINELTMQIVSILGSGGVIAWSLIQKWWASRKLKIALIMPAESTEKQLDTVIKKTSPGLLPIPELPTRHAVDQIVKSEAAKAP